MHTRWARPLRKAGGLSWTTCCTRRRHLTYSSRRRRKPRKCSAVRMEPGTASAGRRAQPGTRREVGGGGGVGARGRGGGRGSPCSTSSGSTGLARWASVSRAALASRSPSTRRRYSSRSRCSSVSLILQGVGVWEELGHLGGWSGARVYGPGHPHLSTVFCRVSKLAWHRSRVRRVRLTLMESMQTLSGERTGLRQADAAAAEGPPRLPARLPAHRCCGPRQRRPQPCGPAPWTPGRQSWGPAGSGSCRPPRWRAGSGDRGGRVTPACLPAPTPRLAARWAPPSLVAEVRQREGPRQLDRQTQTCRQSEEQTEVNRERQTDEQIQAQTNREISAGRQAGRRVGSL